MAEPRPVRGDPALIEEALGYLRALFSFCGERNLRIAQVIGNLGDHYNMEDKEYVDFLRRQWEHISQTY